MLPLATEHIWICRMCTRLAEKVQYGAQGCQAEQCGSPVNGGCFEAYTGPLEGNIDKYCHLCGSDAEGTVSLDGGGHKVGICQHHLIEIYGTPRKEPVS